MKKLVTLASMLLLVGCQSVAPKLEPMKTSAVNNNDWNSKSIQVEELSSDGQWHDLASLSLSKPSSIQGFMARKPEFVLTFEKSAKDKAAGKITVGMDRKLDAICADQSNKMTHVFYEDSVPNAWEETLKCKNGSWKVVLVSSNEINHNLAFK